MCVGVGGEGGAAPRIRGPEDARSLHHRHAASSPSQVSVFFAGGGVSHLCFFVGAGLPVGRLFSALNYSASNKGVSASG